MIVTVVIMVTYSIIIITAIVIKCLSIVIAFVNANSNSKLHFLNAII